MHELQRTAGGRRLLSPNVAAPDQVFSFGSNPALPVTLVGGTIGQGPGDDVELANVLAVSGTATVAIANKTNPDPLVPSVQRFTFSGPLTGTAGGLLRVVASDTTSGLARSRATFACPGGNTFTGTVSPGPFASARFTGDFAPTAVALAGGTVEGSGVIRLVSGAGIVSPDGTSGSDGILTAGSLSPAGGTDFDFDLGAAGTQPAWSNPTQSVNDVLRLTGTAAFATPLASANVVRLFVGAATLASGDWFDAGFFSATNQSAAIGGGTFATYVLGDGLGADVEHSGLRYYTLANWNTKAGTALASTVTMVSTTASFDGSTQTPGWIMRTTYAPAPGTITITVPSGTQTQTAAGYPLLSGSIPIVKTGAGTLVVDQANTLTGSTTVQGGVLRITTAAALASSPLGVVAGGTAQVAPYLVASVAGLDLSGTGLVDVTNGGLTVASGLSTADLVAKLLEGRNGGSWDGSSGITSSVTAAQVAASELRAVGWLDNGDGSLTVAYSAPGDTNLDWVVDILDVSNFVAGGKFGTGDPAGWSEGDFNYDGVVDIQDVADFSATGLYGGASYNAAPGIAAVPEPGVTAVMLGGMLVAAFNAAARRRWTR